MTSARPNDYQLTTAGRSPLAFIGLLFAISVPFWLARQVIDFQVLPGLPLMGVLIAFCPMVAAAILVYRENGWPGLTRFLGRAFDYRRISVKSWYAPIILLMPAVSVLSYAYMRLTAQTLPSPYLPLLALPSMILGFFIGGVGEELGWSGYATEPIQARTGAVNAGILLGIVWAAWHIPLLLQQHHAAAWIAWWCVGTVASRVVIVWLFNNTGMSVFAVIVFHVAQNLSWQLFPKSGSHWDPRLNGIILTIAAIVISLTYDSRTLTRLRVVRQSQRSV